MRAERGSGLTLRYLSLFSGIEGRTVKQRDTWTVIARSAKRSSELRDDNHAWGLVRSVSQESEGDRVFDITVADDHSFVCDGIVVHNCQDLSVAGKRKGLEGARSGLFFTAINIVRWARTWGDCRFALWENVPGAFSSNKGADFAAVVDALAGLDGTVVPPKGWGTEGCAVGEEAMVEWATLDAQWFGVAQKRRRVFALADFGDWSSRPPILLEPEGMRGDSAPRRGSGEGVAGAVARSVALRGREGGGTAELGGDIAGTIRATGGGGDKPHVLLAQQRPVLNVCAEVAPTRQAGQDGPGRDADSATSLVAVLPFDTTQVTSPTNGSRPQWGDPCHPLTSQGHSPTAIRAFNARQDPDSWFDRTGPLESSGPQAQAVVYTIQHAVVGRHDAAGPQGKGWQQDVSFTQDSRTSAVVYGCDTYNGTITGDVAAILSTQSGDGLSSGPSVLTPYAVRRLTPTECERLQAFPDGYTQVPSRGKPAADGPRYKALGNSMCVNVMHWIGKEIDFAWRFFR